MERMIDAKELSHRLCNGFISHDGYVDGEFVDVFKDNGFELFANKGDNDYMRFMEQVIRIVESIPEVDAEPVKHGSWILGRDEMSRLYTTCDNCKTCVCFTNYRNGMKVDMRGANYCPNCGAKMGKEEQNG